MITDQARPDGPAVRFPDRRPHPDAAPRDVALRPVDDAADLRGVLAEDMVLRLTRSELSIRTAFRRRPGQVLVCEALLREARGDARASGL